MSKPYRTPEEPPPPDDPAHDPGDAPIPSKQLEARYRALVDDGDESPMRAGFKTGLKTVAVLIVSGFIAHNCFNDGCSCNSSPPPAPHAP